MFSLLLSGLLTLGFYLYEYYNPAAQEPQVFQRYMIGIVLLAINYISKDVLIALVQRMPLPKRLTQEKES